MVKKVKIKFLAAILAVCFAGVISSCYYDYGIDPDSSNVVVTLYDQTYNFGAVNTYYLLNTVYVLGDGSIDTAGLHNIIIPTMRTNLTNLGWTEVAIADSASSDVVVGAGVTNTTIVVNSGYYYWDYWGGWYYPPYYGGGYTYSYTTGTLAMLISDRDIMETDADAVVWTGVINGASGQTTPTQTLITNGINQAFSQQQSPYLY